MQYTNPLTAKNFPSAHYGDPFVFRFLGIYYLFVSTPSNDTKIRCYKSTDLVNFEFLAIAADDPLLEAAYAPEILYAYNKFYLITSPGGNGHYIYTATKPEGPYTRLTNNVQSMIDGSFFVSSDGKLHLLRADHAGIALLDVSEDGVLSNRRNLKTYLNAWTEGPGAFYRDGYYYLTYCGNNLLSKGYRVAYATSKHFDRDYQVATNNPIIISTMDNFTAFGHNSNVLGPDLDSWYSVYHVNEEAEIGFKPRRFFVDRYEFNGRLMHLNTSDFRRPIPLRPAWESYEPLKDLQNKNSLLFLPTESGDSFTFETSFYGLQTSILLGYKDVANYTEFSFTKTELIIKIQCGNETRFRRTPLHFDFNFIHTVRIINSKEKAELIIDNAFICNFEPVKNGRIAIKNAKELAYTALSKYAFGTSSKDYDSVIPGLIAVTKEDYSELVFDKDDEVYAKRLKSEKYPVIAREKAKYGLFMYAYIKDSARVRVNGKEVTLKQTPSEYTYLSYYLGDYVLDRKDHIHIELIDGEILYKYINVSKYYNLPPQLTFKKGTHYIPSDEEDSYFLSKEQMGTFDLSVSFHLSKLNTYDTFGIIVASHQYANKYFQARYPLLGYLVGFEGDLLIIDRLNYGRERIYDRPLPLNLGMIYQLRVSFDNGRFNVFINDLLKIETTVSDPAFVGGFGLFASIGSNLKFGPLINNDKPRKEDKK